jgi:hypothetical protein
MPGAPFPLDTAEVLSRVLGGNSEILDVSWPVTEVSSIDTRVSRVSRVDSVSCAHSWQNYTYHATT